MPRREAVIHYEENWPWPGKPWPWCPFAELRNSVDTLIHLDIPHDHHLVNEGNTWCPGVPGMIEVAEDDKYLVPKPKAEVLSTRQILDRMLVNATANRASSYYLEALKDAIMYDNAHAKDR